MTATAPALSKSKPDSIPSIRDVKGGSVPAREQPTTMFPAWSCRLDPASTPATRHRGRVPSS